MSRITSSDVKFHDFFWREMFHHEIFQKYLKKFHDVFSGSTLTRLMFPGGEGCGGTPLPAPYPSRRLGFLD